MRRELGCGQELRVFLTAYQKSGAWDCTALTNETEAAPLLSGAASVSFSVCPHRFIQKPGRRSCAQRDGFRAGGVWGPLCR